MGVLTLGVTMGQWLSIPMILAGIAVLIWSKRQAISNPNLQNNNSRKRKKR